MKVTDKITITNEDNMLMMARYPDNYFDLAIVDPPYGIDAGKMTMGSGKHNFKKGKDWDSAIPNQEYFNELMRVSKNQIIWGGNYFPLPLNNNWIIWDKLNPNLSFSEGEMAWCSIKKNVRIFKRYSAMEDYDGKKQHPTQKPIKHIAIENPVSVISSQIRKPDQIIHPYHFGEKASKSTCLWLKNLPKLKHTNIVEKGEFKEWVDKKTGKTKRQATWIYDCLQQAKSPEHLRTLRSKTFQGIADAIAEQWGGKIN